MRQHKLFISLKKKGDISKIFDNGLKLYSSNVLLRYLKVNDDDVEHLPFYVLFAFPKKKLGAIKRNRLKRICKSAMFQAMKNMLPMELRNSFHIIIHARESFDDISEKSRILEFENLFSRLIKNDE